MYIYIYIHICNICKYNYIYIYIYVCICQYNCVYIYTVHYMKQQPEELYHDPKHRWHYPFGPRGVILTPSAFRNSTSLFRLGLWWDAERQPESMMTFGKTRIMIWWFMVIYIYGLWWLYMIIYIYVDLWWYIYIYIYTYMVIYDDLWWYIYIWLGWWWWWRWWWCWWWSDT